MPSSKKKTDEKKEGKEKAEEKNLVGIVGGGVGSRKRDKSGEGPPT